MTWGRFLRCLAGGTALLALLAEAPAHADAKITGLADASFGTLNPTIDASISDNVCAFSRTGGFFGGAGYGVRATGNGSGGAFTLASGPRTLAYEVRWADSPNQTGGTQLTAGVLATGFDNSAFFQDCQGQTQGTASLTVTLRSTQISAATAGNYTGVLSIQIVPE